MKLSPKHTLAAGYIGYATQALAINFTPLLFITFEKSYNISLGKIGLLIAISFLTQLTVDAIAAKYASRIDTRKTVVVGHICAALGMVLLSFLPEVMPDAFTGLVIPTMLTAIGGGIIEVLISPIIEACPTKEKSASMSLLHSFYSWGSVATIFLSTLFFGFFGTQNWKILALIWAMLPLSGALMFSFVPIYSLKNEEILSCETGEKSLLRSGLFWMLFAVMFCAGASEMAMSQWASTFAEKGLGVSKALGDLAGPCLFSILMGCSRVFYAKFGEKIDLVVFIIGSCVLCVGAYLLASLAESPILGLIGCGLCGLSVGILWPGVFSIAAVRVPAGGTAMFAYLALAGDLGCSGGPTVVGMVASAFGDNLNTGLLAALVFPVVLILGCIIIRKK